MDAKRRALLRLALDLDASLVRLDDPANDRKAEAGASRVRPAGAIAAAETLEDVGLIPRRDADPRVRDLDRRFARSGAQPDADPAFRRRVPDRVLEQVVEDLLHPILIDERPDRLVRDFGREVDASVARRGEQVPRDVRHEPREVRVREGERDPPALTAR